MSLRLPNTNSSVLPLASLARYLAEQGLTASPDGLVGARRVGEGQSNLTFILTLGDGGEVILRRPPPGPLPPSAHDVLRELRVIRGLSGSAVPVPRPLLGCEDPTVIGAPFYVMERVAGDALRAELPPAFDAARLDERRGFGERAIDALAALHTLEPSAVGLSDLGRPSGYLARQLKRWRGQLEFARTRPVEDLDQVADWLDRYLPPSENVARLVHGDYKLDNLLFAPTPPVRLLAVVDWELATLGDPLADLGWLLAFWRQADDPPPELKIIPRLTELPGFSTRAALAERYAEQARVRLPDLTFYVVFALWKMAVLLEGHWARHVRGDAPEFDFGYLELGGPSFAARIRRTAEGPT